MSKIKGSPLLLTLDQKLLRDIRKSAEDKGCTVSQLAAVLFTTHLHKEKHDPEYTIYFFPTIEKKEE